jgi:ElaB/YqjD/DUF883 family membrane-anchored ribosome-binding protein
MFHFLLPLVLTTPGLLAGVSGFYEHIQISDNLSIRAEYAPKDTVLKHEAMLLSVEDFAIVQSEVETSIDACNSRLDDLTAKHQETLREVQHRCEERHDTTKSELKDSLELNKRLSEDLKTTESSLRMHKWVSIGLLVGSSITLTYALTR